ncbi:hypothetical protein ACU635_23615 [[Actinomadura] parvosata]|uniref:hypothetical protein n=1 Tax=[Actinomadura] parvosata TaxID=1955412 RepID=UPI00406BEC01
MDTEHDWTLLPAVVVRSAGFPWELVLSLVHPRAAETAAAVVRLERQALDLLAEAPGRDPDARPPGAPNGRAGSGRLSRGLRGRLRSLRPLPDDTPGPEDWLTAWNDVTARLEEARLTLSGLVAGDAARARAAVAEIVADERFLDALVSDAPGLYRDLRRGAKGGRTRRELAEQVQRLSASCETAGCYGPVNYGAVTAGHRGGYTWEGAAACARRVAYPAARVSEALQQRVLAEPALVAGLVPRRKTWTGEVLDGAAFVGHCDGGRTLAEIAARTGAGVERASAALAVAVRRGLLTHDLCPPATICDPLGWLRERLIARGVRVAAGDAPAEESGARPAPGHGRGAFSGRCECGCAEASGRGRAGREESTGRERAGDEESDGPGRAGGEEGAGRGREGGGAWEPRVRRLLASGVPKRAFAARGGVPAQRVRATIGARSVQDAHLPLGRRVGEISELLARYPAASPDVKLAVQRRVEALAGGGRQDDRAVVHEAAAGTLRVTVGDALAADLRGRVPKVLDLLAEEAELTRRRTNRLLAGRLGPGTYELAEVLRSTGDLEIEHGDRLAARIAALVREAPAGATELNLAGLLDDPAPPAAPVLCSADVMVAAPALEAYEPGITPLVLSRLHDAVLLTPWALQFHEEGAACLAERDAAIRRALSGFTVLNVISRRTNGVPPLELPGPVLELGGVAADPRRRRIGLDELYVHSDGRRAVLHAKGMEEPLLLHNGEHDTALHTAFALPRIRAPRLAELSRVPRLTWDNVVISRRRWRLERASFEALAQAGDDRELLVAMARLREAHDLPEAFYAATPRERRSFYVDTRSPALLEGLARLAAAAERITLTEVLPGPDACWLREGERRYAAELRCVYLRPAGKGAASADRVAQAERASAPSDEGGSRQAGAGTRSGRARQPARPAVRQPGGATPQPGRSGPQPGDPAARPGDPAPQPGDPAARLGDPAPQPSGAVPQPGGAVPQPVVPLRRSHGSAGPVQQLHPHGAGPQWFVRQAAGPTRHAHGPAHRAPHSHPYPWPGEGG